MPVWIGESGRRRSLSRQGLQRVARGRGAIATTTPGLGVLLNPHPGGRAGKVERATEIQGFRDPLPGSNPFAAPVPGCSAGIRPRPGATLSDPCRDQEVIQAK